MIDSGDLDVHDQQHWQQSKAFLVQRTLVTRSMVEDDGQLQLDV